MNFSRYISAHIIAPVLLVGFLGFLAVVSAWRWIRNQPKPYDDIDGEREGDA